MLRRLRMAAGVTQGTFGTMFGYNAQSVSRFSKVERGTVNTSRLDAAIVKYLTDASLERILGVMVADALVIQSATRRRIRQEPKKVHANYIKWFVKRTPKIKFYSRGDDWEENPRHREKIFSLSGEKPKGVLRL